PPGGPLRPSPTPRHQPRRAGGSARPSPAWFSGQLGHSSIALTADTYTSVLPAAQYKAAEATARLVLDAARNDRDRIATVARRVRQMSDGLASHGTASAK